MTESNCLSRVYEALEMPYLPPASVQGEGCAPSHIRSSDVWFNFLPNPVIKNNDLKHMQYYRYPILADI